MSRGAKQFNLNFPGRDGIIRFIVHADATGQLAGVDEQGAPLAAPADGDWARLLIERIEALSPDADRQANLKSAQAVLAILAETDPWTPLGAPPPRGLTG